jgi:mercuric reductase
LIGRCTNAKIGKALRRLTGILPLGERQIEIGGELRELHRQVLRSFVSRGRILSRQEMARQLSNPDHAVDVLSRSGLVIFSADGEPLAAYPFTMEPREHRVQVNGHRVHAMCALDALAVSPMFGMATQIDSRCAVSAERVRILQSGRKIRNPGAAGDFHVGIAWGAADPDASCADSICRQMMFLRDRKIARLWLAADAANREIFTLPQALEFAERLFVPLMS